MNDEVRMTKMLSTPKYRCEDQMEFFRFLPRWFCFFTQVWDGANDHAEKELCFACFFLADSDLVAEILLRYCVVGFTIVRANAGSRTDQLVDQSLRDRIDRDQLGKIDDCLTEFGGPLLKVEGSTIFTTVRHSCFVILSSFVIRHSSFYSVPFMTKGHLQQHTQPHFKDVPHERFTPPV